MIHGINGAQCLCICACVFPDPKGQEDSMDYTHAVEALFDTKLEAIRWAAATRQRKSYQLGLPFTALGREVRHTTQGWLATISWNE